MDSYLFSMSTPLITGVEPSRTRSDPAYWFAFLSDKLLVSIKDASFQIPFKQDVAALALRFDGQQFLGIHNGINCYAVELLEDISLSKSMQLIGLRKLFGQIHDDFFSIAGRAAQILYWHKTHRYCGRCGTIMHENKGELARECAKCGFLCYPRLSPAVIMAVIRGCEILLARSSHHRKGMYTTLAGFVEPGETLEEAVMREVKEEVNIDIKNIRYFASQPWPFPHSLMIGFTAEYAGGEIRLDKTEIEDAQWFSSKSIPDIPSRMTISRALIDNFLDCMPSSHPSL